MILSPGAKIVLSLAIVSSILILVWPVPEKEGRPLWTFTKRHLELYEGVITEWNSTHPPEERYAPLALSLQALERRLLSGFLADTPLPALVEVETNTVTKFFSGPLDAVGFVDLTDRLAEEGLLEQINEPSFAPWTSRGRIFGIPHDVHPVMLAYRADIVEAAGIDVNQIETWDDFVRVMAPLQADRDGDGHPDRYLLNVWETDGGTLEILLLQAGGGFFDEHGELTIASPIAARVISQIVNWTAGPDRIGANIQLFTGEGRQLLTEGYVVCNMTPDWLAGIFFREMPSLDGKIKFMPLPAWEPGGRRTSVQGGTMLGIPKGGEDFESTWEFAKKLYTDPATVEGMFRENLIVTPMKSLWDHPVYDEPIPFFNNQPVGRLYLNLAPDVPRRSSSAFKVDANRAMIDAMIRLKRWAIANDTYEVEKLIPEAEKELAQAARYIEKKMAANRFLQDQAATSASPETVQISHAPPVAEPSPPVSASSAP